MREEYAERAARNDRSRNDADSHGMSWEAEELEFLIAFFNEARGNPDAEGEVAHALGRTIEACRQRFYEHRSGKRVIGVFRTTTTTTTTSTTRYIGAQDDPEDRWWDSDYYTDKEG